ncbi:MAG: amidase [Rhizobiaceae bacterium]
MTQADRILSAAETAQRYLDRVGKRDPHVHAFAHLAPERVLAEAANDDAHSRGKPLHGTMIAVKDVIDAAGWPTSCNSPICPGLPVDKDAEVVARLKQAGATIFGKTVTTEFAFTEPGPTTNPLDFTRTPGGSSSGSAAAVADYQVDAALTTQTGGSTIRPAAFCGIFGYKPCFGRVPNLGLRLLSPSFDTIGLHARSVSQLARVASVMEGRERPVESGMDIDFVHVQLPGVPDAEPYVTSAVSDAADRLRAKHLTVRELSLPEEFDAVNEAHRVVMSYEMTQTFAADMRDHQDLLSESIRSFIEIGYGQSDHDVSTARATLANWRADLAALFAPNEVMIMPATVAEAHVGLESTGSASFNRAWTALGTAALTIPFGKGPAGMPLGLQIVDPHSLGDLVFPAAQQAATALDATVMPMDKLDGR